jgi:hypothetical protein
VYRLSEWEEEVFLQLMRKVDAKEEMVVGRGSIYVESQHVDVDSSMGFDC